MDSNGVILWSMCVVLDHLLLEFFLHIRVKDMGGSHFAGDSSSVLASFVFCAVFHCQVHGTSQPQRF